MRSIELLSLSSILWLLACDGGGTGGAGGGGAGGGGGDGGAGLAPAICNTAASAWTPGTQAFEEATAAWGLEAAGALGTRLNAVDFDGDGWTDLVVRFGGNAPDDFSTGGARKTWLLRNTGAGTFEDVTIASGIRQNRTETDPDLGRPGDVFAWGDVDNDGDLDVMTGRTLDTNNPTVETTELLLNDGDGTFSLGPPDQPFHKNNDAVAGISFVDYDRDGILDVWVVQNTLNGVPLQDRLYRGYGDGNFVDVTTEMGMKTLSWGSAATADLDAALGHSIGWSSHACDLNNDGDPELLAGSYGRAPNHLWLSTGAAGPYQNQSVASGYAYDENMDWSDNESARCWCMLHPMDVGCQGIPPPMYIVCNVDADAFRWNHATDMNPYRLGGNSGATQCADVDNDGWMDLVTGEIVHWDVGQSSDSAELLLNAQDPMVAFTRPGNAATGLERSYDVISWNEGIMTGAVLDFDNDGWADLYLGNSDYPGDHGLLFHQDAPAHFEAVPLSQGIDHHRSHGIAVADFDHDGDLDVVVGHSFARCQADPNDDSPCYPTQQVRFFENVIGDQGNFLSVRLVGGPGTNRAAIGARVSVTAGGITQTKDVEGGHGHYGAHDDLALLFGLGNACEAEVVIRWPDATLTTQSVHLVAGYRFTIEQGLEPVVEE